MPVPIQLLPSPALDRSLVPYTVTNFNRIRDAFQHVGTTVSFIFGVQAGPWPLTINVDVPYQADVLVWSELTYWSSIAGAFIACQLQWDGVTQPSLFEQYFNEANSHKTMSATNIMRKQAAGSHAMKVDALTGGVMSDLNDRWRWAVVFLEVLGS